MKKILPGKVLPAVMLLACLVLLTSCGGGGDGGGGGSSPAPTGVPVLRTLTLSPSTVTAGRTVSLQVSFTFLDSQGDLDGGTLYLNYDSTTYTASLSGALAGITDGATPAPVPVTVPLNSTNGTMDVSIWVEDRDGNASNTLHASLSQMSFGSQVWGSAGEDRMTGTAIDGSGNIYLVGYTSGDLDGEPNQGGTDAFLTKYDAAGNRQWTRLIPGTLGDDAAWAVAVVGSDVYVAGETNFEEDTQGSGFLAKYDAAGNIQWGGPVSIDAAELATARGVAVSGGFIYVAGYAKGNLNGQANMGAEDPFLMKFNASGVAQWTKLWGEPDRDYAFGVTVDGSGNIFVVGTTSGDLGGETNAGESDAFVTKFDGSGVRGWTLLVGGTGPDGGRAVATDTAGNIYLAGDLVNASADAFFAKFDPAGSPLWQTIVSSPHCDVINGIALDDSGSIYGVGWTAGDLADLDSLPNLGSDDAFLVKFNASSGALLWTKLWGTSDRDHAVGLALDSAGDIHVAGDTLGILDGYANSGASDLFLFKFNSAGQRQ